MLEMFLNCLVTSHATYSKGYATLWMDDPHCKLPLWDVWWPLV